MWWAWACFSHFSKCNCFQYLILYTICMLCTLLIKLLIIINNYLIKRLFVFQQIKMTKTFCSIHKNLYKISGEREWATRNKVRTNQSNSLKITNYTRASNKFLFLCFVGFKCDITLARHIIDVFSNFVWSVVFICLLLCLGNFVFRIVSSKIFNNHWLRSSTWKSKFGVHLVFRCFFLARLLSLLQY